ncbi:MAG: VWA domain-containing protein [Prevotella sp.]|nr:VWA domain-containing protein [Prevotella sp.]
MKKFTFTIVCIYIPLVLMAQIQKERRVYYLDCSYSMVSYKLWNKVRDNLIGAIDNISDETTEIIIIPFAFDSSTNPLLTPISALATKSGKDMLKKKINALPMSKKTMTYHYVPINDFYNNRVNSNRITYMFLMTDGQDEDNLQRTKTKLLPQWGEKYGNRNVFGFYVMLNDCAKDPNIDKIISNQSHLWKVETADVDINLIRLQNNAIFNVRNEKYFDIPIYGNIKGMNFNASFPRSSPYKVEKCSLEGNRLRVYVTSEKDVHKLPIASNQQLTISMSGGGQFDFLVTDNIVVKCESKPERSLKITVR